MRRRHSSSVAQAASSMGIALIARCTAASNATSRRVSNGTRSAGGTPQRHSSGTGYRPLACLERSADAGTTISNLFDFDRARRFHLPAERAPDILDCGNCAIDLILREIATDLSRRSTRQPCANCGSHPPLIITRSVVPILPRRSEHGAPLLCEREPRPKMFDETLYRHGPHRLDGDAGLRPFRAGDDAPARDSGVSV